MDTFDDLQRPFPLFKAPIGHATVSMDLATAFDAADILALVSGMLAMTASVQANSTPVMDTEFGMVTRDDANAGRTHGIPLNDPSTITGYRLTPHPVDTRFPR